MYIFYNGELIDDSELNMHQNNRAFQYGDGLFETMIYDHGDIKFTDLHQERLISGMNVLGYSLPEGITIDGIFDKLNDLVTLAGLTSARIRLQLWRKTGGLYTPTSNKVDILATCRAHEENNAMIKESVGISEVVQLTSTPWSRFKTTSAMAYIQAGIEKTARSLDELILLDQNGNISECTSSNLFWKIGESYYTPSLDTGCIDGILRKHIINTLQENSVKINIGKYPLEALEQASEVFTSNVTGTCPIRRIDSWSYNTNFSIRPLLAL